MRVAFITPVPELERFATASTYHLILTHICDQYPEYVEFYRERSKAGDYIILDNSAYELGESVSIELLRKYADIIEPAVVVLPDVRNDAKETLRRTREAIEVLRDPRWTLMAVPQAPDTDNKDHDFEAWVASLKSMYEFPEIGAIGIYPETSWFFPTPRRGRVELAEILEERGLIRKDRTYHMLGMADNPVELKGLSQFEWIMGCDSAKPIVQGMHGVLLHPVEGLLTIRPRRPKDYFSRSFDEFQSFCVRYNQAVILSWIQGKDGPSWTEFLSNLQ